MTASPQALVFTLDSEDSAKQLGAELGTLESPGEIVRRAHLDGSAATWLVVATTAVTTLPKILESLAKVIEALKVRSIRVGTTEIRNPTAADIRRLSKTAEASGSAD